MSRYHIVRLSGTSTTVRLERTLRDTGGPRRIALRGVIHPANLATNANISYAFVRCRQINAALSGTLDGKDSDYLGVFPVEAAKIFAHLPASPEYKALPQGEVTELELSLINNDGAPINATGVVLTLETQGS